MKQRVLTSVNNLYDLTKYKLKYRVEHELYLPKKYINFVSVRRYINNANLLVYS